MPRDVATMQYVSPAHVGAVAFVADHGVSRQVDAGVVISFSVSKGSCRCKYRCPRSTPRRRTAARTFDAAAFSLARSLKPRYDGTAIASRMPMMTMTTRSSISVNPSSRASRSRIVPLVLLWIVVEVHGLFIAHAPPRPHHPFGSTRTGARSRSRRRESRPAPRPPERGLRLRSCAVIPVRMTSAAQPLPAADGLVVARVTRRSAGRSRGAPPRGRRRRSCGGPRRRSGASGLTGSRRCRPPRRSSAT